MPIYNMASLLNGLQGKMLVEKVIWSEVGDIPETVMTTTRAPAMLKINQNSLQRGKAGKK